ncbi:MAG: CARDB domain-containing protein [Anaerolineae bacterium]
MILSLLAAHTIARPLAFSPRSLPDLAFTSSGILVVSTPWVGQPTKVAASITNRGDAVAESVTVGFTVDGTLLSRVTLPLLPPGTTIEPVVIWIPRGPGGLHTLSAVVDPDDTVPEEDETNNGAERSVFVAPGPYALFLPQVTKGAHPSAVPLVLVADETDATAAAPLIEAMGEQNMAVIRAAQFPTYRTYPSIVVIAGLASDPAGWALALELLSPEEQAQVLSSDAPLAFVKTDRYVEGQSITIYTGRTRELVRRAVEGAAPVPPRPTPEPVEGAVAPTPIPLPTPVGSSDTIPLMPSQAGGDLPQQCLDALKNCLRDPQADREACYASLLQCAVDGVAQNAGLPTWFQDHPLSCWLDLADQVKHWKEWLSPAGQCLADTFCYLFGGWACSMADLITAFTPKEPNAGLVLIFPNSGDPLPAHEVFMQLQGGLSGQMTGDHNPWVMEYPLFPLPFWYHFQQVTVPSGDGHKRFSPDGIPVQFVVLRFIEEKPCSPSICTFIYILHVILEPYSVDYSIQPVYKYYDEPNRPPRETVSGAEKYYPAPDYGQPAGVAQFPGQDCAVYRPYPDKRYVLDFYQVDSGPKMPVAACQDPKNQKSSTFHVTMDRPHRLTLGYRRTYPDPAVVSGSLTVSPSPAQQGELVHIEAVVENVGELPAEDLEVAIRVDGQTIQTEQFWYVPPRGKKYPMADWNSQGAATGLHFVEIVVDPADTIAEGWDGEHNNRDVTTVTLTAPTLPDLTFTDRVHDVSYLGPPNLWVGDVVTLTARVSNVSPVGADDVVVEFRDGEGPVIGRDTIPIVYGMGNETAMVTWDTAGAAPGQHCILATIDPDNTVRELQEGWDNTAATCLYLFGPTPTETPTPTPTSTPTPTATPTGQPPNKGGIRGTVTCQDDPIADAEVTVSGPLPWTVVAWSGSTDRDGHYDTGLVLDPGDYGVTVAPPAGSQMTFAPAQVTVMAGQYSVQDFACTVTATPTSTPTPARTQMPMSIPTATQTPTPTPTPTGEVILSVPGLGEILYAGAANCNMVSIRSTRPVIECP